MLADEVLCFTDGGSRKLDWDPTSTKKGAWSVWISLDFRVGYGLMLGENIATLGITNRSLSNLPIVGQGSWIAFSYCGIVLNTRIHLTRGATLHPSWNRMDRARGSFVRRFPSSICAVGVGRR